MLGTDIKQLFHVSVFGEAELCLFSLKILVLVVVFLTCFIIALGGQPSGIRPGFSYWQEPGALATYVHEGSLGRMLGLWVAIIQACFAYTGTEVVGVAFGETPNPRKNVPKAIRQTAVRILVFYILGVLILGMCVPYNNKLFLNATKASTSAGKFPSNEELCSCWHHGSCFSIRYCHSTGKYQVFPGYLQCISTDICAQCSQLRYLVIGKSSQEWH